MTWDANKFQGEPIFQNNFAHSTELHCKLSGDSWILTNIYAPCTPDRKIEFLDWFKRILMPDDEKWLIVGDFNLLRKLEDRNKPGGSVQEMLLFNEAISCLRLTEIPLKGVKFKWTNKQINPLLERLDWFFSSSSWITNYPNTCASTLSRNSSDHNPYVISISNTMPAPQIFHFENYWLQHEQFSSVMQQAWGYHTPFFDKAKVISAKFKNLRKALRSWKSQVPSLAKTIQNTKNVLLFLDIIEESKDLSLQECTFREIISSHLNNLLQQQKLYWQQRSSINWAKMGDESTRFFHARASTRNKVNHISCLHDSSGQAIFEHEAKAQLLREAYKERMRKCEFTHMYFDLSSLITPMEGLDWLEAPFSREEIDKIIKELPSNKSPGPDGFNGEFLKKCWHEVAEDFYALCEGFLTGKYVYKASMPPISPLYRKKNVLWRWEISDLFLF